MKKIEELNKSKLPIAIYDNQLDTYEKMPLFQEKLAKANAILEKNMPLAFLKTKKNQRIKQYFEQQIPVEQIAKQLDLPKSEVLLCLEEIGLIEVAS